MHNTVHYVCRYSHTLLYKQNKWLNMKVAHYYSCTYRYIFSDPLVFPKELVTKKDFWINRTASSQILNRYKRYTRCAVMLQNQIKKV